MKTRIVFFVTCILFICLTPQTGQTCTSFCLDNGEQPIYGKSFDNPTVSDALIVVNKRNVLKTALIDPEDDGEPASWVSKYGSITFNFLGREFPITGMNDAGLVVDALTFYIAEYPMADSRPYVNGMQWVQYQLDNFGTVQEVITNDLQLRITFTSGAHPCFYLVCDRTGRCAVIEFIEGKMVYYTDENMPVNVLSGPGVFDYAKFVEFWEEGELPTPDSFDSVHRFSVAADMVKDYDPITSGPAVDYAFDILSNLEMWLYERPITRWRIVYDITNLTIYYHTIENQQTRHFDFNSFGSSCKTPVKVLDIKEDLSGDVSNDFIDYTYEINRDMIKKAIPDISDEDLDAFANHPETTICTELDCFITTAAYGSPIEPQVKVLREFRDRFLLDNTMGKTFVKLYNTHSPPLTDFIARHDNLRKVVRLGLLPMVSMSWVVLKLGLATTLLLIFLLMVSIKAAMVVVHKEVA